MSELRFSFTLVIAVLMLCSCARPQRLSVESIADLPESDLRELFQAASSLISEFRTEGILRKVIKRNDLPDELKFFGFPNSGGAS